MGRDKENGKKEKASDKKSRSRDKEKGRKDRRSRSRDKDRRRSRDKRSRERERERRERERERERERRKEKSSSSSSSSEEEGPAAAAGAAAALALAVAPPGSIAATAAAIAQLGAQDAVGAFCRASGVDQNSELALRALPPQLQQVVVAEGAIMGMNPSAILIARIRKVETAVPIGSVTPPPGYRPRPETVAAAAAGDPVAIFCTQHGVDYSAENALRALPVELQCRVLNEGPLRAQNPSAVLMSRVRKSQQLLAEMRRANALAGRPLT